MPAPILKVVAETPGPVQGEIKDNPMPAPNETKRRVNAADATPPAAMAGHDTPDD
jgi:hypothetical protein